MAKNTSMIDAEQVGGFSGRAIGGTIKVNRKVYATGLVWESVTEIKGKSPISQARESARTHSGDLVCLRKPAKAQYGIGSTGVGHKKGMAPLASFLAEAIEGNFIAVFEVENGFYLAAVRDDQVLAGCDRLFADQQEAMEVFAELYYGSTWNQSIAPKEWGIDGTASSILEEILGGFRPKSTLEPASLKSFYLKILILIALLVGGFIAYQQYENYQQEQAFQAEQARLAAERDKARKDREANQIPPIPFPWTGKNQGIPTMIACIDGILAAPTDIAGWSPVSLQCNDNRVTFGLKRDGGTLNWVGALISKSGSRPVVNQTSRDTVVVSWQLPKGPTYTEDAETTQRDKVRRYLTSQFEEIFQPIEIKLEDPKPIQVKSGRGTTTIQTPYQGLAFSIRTRHDPKEFVSILSPIPALVLTSVKLDLATWTWQIEGNVYEKLNPTPTQTNRPTRTPTPQPTTR